ncbi:MAG: DUF2752 domain-containing protein [Bacteroidales bacterium]|nr:DUF2752 domain-containing protein [Bacteroidales bacterium]MCF8386362.1 DUF2752 domain-containing protein [Bacteroidales bacterium]MCF8396796.1 DUF2752 domain-containing protein [Bacteroidales bacterium]
MDIKKVKIFLWRSLEAFIWMGALVFLAFQDPGVHHYSLCPLHNLGLDFCPGCGLGRSISAFFQGDLKTSFELHPLGFFAVIILSVRIFMVFKNAFNYMKVVTKT